VPGKERAISVNIFSVIIYRLSTLSTKNNLFLSA
jgi:hypothetical protein